LNLWLVHRLHAMADFTQRRVSFLANWHEFPGGGLGGMDYAGTGKLLQELVRVGGVFLRCLGPSERGDRLAPRVAGLARLADYLSSAPQMGFKFDAFVNERSHEAPKSLRRLFNQLASQVTTVALPRDEMDRVLTGIRRTEEQHVYRQFIRRL
jgi:hypothetical protein